MSNHEPGPAIRESQGIPPGLRDVACNIWAHPRRGLIAWASHSGEGNDQGLTFSQICELNTWEASPGEYVVASEDRPQAWELTILQRGRVTYYPTGGQPFTLSAPASFVRPPGWDGRAVVHEAVVEAFVWVEP